MAFDDELPTKPKPTFSPTNLELLSVAAMREYVADLQGEIVRTQEEISKRETQRSLAESFFKK